MTQRLTLSVARRTREPQLTQEALADLVGVDQTYISLIEASKRVPSDGLKARLAKALGIAPSDIRFPTHDPKRRVGAKRDRTGQARKRKAAA